MTSNVKEEKDKSMYKNVLPKRLTFKSLYKIYKKLYESDSIEKNGAAYHRMINFKSKIQPK